MSVVQRCPRAGWGRGVVAAATDPLVSKNV